MKKLLAAAVLAVTASTAMAYGYGHGHHGGGGHWIGPALLGGIITYELMRPPVYVAPPQPVYVAPPQPTVVPPAPYGYHYTYMWDSYCSCQKLVMVPN